jgi:DNA-binding Lrp family transcriptional regulator
MRFTQKISDRAILATLREVGPTRMSVLANDLGVTRQAMSLRLRRLERMRKVTRTKGDKSIRQPDTWRIPGMTKGRGGGNGTECAV